MKCFYNFCFKCHKQVKETEDTFLINLNIFSLLTVLQKNLQWLPTHCAIWPVISISLAEILIENIVWVLLFGLQNQL